VLPSFTFDVVTPKKCIAPLNPKSAAVTVCSLDPSYDLDPHLRDLATLFAVVAVIALVAVFALPSTSPLRFPFIVFKNLDVPLTIRLPKVAESAFSSLVIFTDELNVLAAEIVCSVSIVARFGLF